MIWIIIIISIAFSAFFSGMEIAFVSSNKLRLELASHNTSFSSRILSIFNKHQSQFISTMLVGNNLVLVIYGIFMAKLLENPISIYIDNELYILILQTLISTLLILVFAEFIPKTLFRIVSNSALKTFSIPLVLFYYLFYPVVSFSIWLSGLIMRLLFNIRIDEKQKDKVFGRIDIDEMIENSKTDNDKVNKTQELKIFQNAMDFSSIKLRECIVPRNEIIAMPNDSEIIELKERFIETGHSNILIYKDTVDEITGYVNIKDILKNPQKIKNIIRQVMIVPETMSAKKLFQQLIKDKKSLAIVVDEFGSTSGIVTIEDIMEEIFGEFEDEHDTPEYNIQITDDGNYIIAGRYEVDAFNEEYDFDLRESDDYETIAGYIMYHSGNFPKEGDIINIVDSTNKYKFKILKIQDTKIEKLMLYGR